MPELDDALAALVPVSDRAGDEGRARQELLTKPSGSLGDLEMVGIQLCAISRTCPPPVPSPATVAIFAGDHGSLEEGVSPWPQEVTGQMVANFCSGGAAVNVLARHVGADVVVVDVGVASDLPPAPALVRAKVRRGTANVARGPAMERVEAIRAMDVGVGVAYDLVAKGSRCLLTGDMGIGNTTASAALIAAFCEKSPQSVTGIGTGIDAEGLARKVEVVRKAVSRVERGTDDAVEVLASVGGLEIAALAGYAIGGAACGIPVVLDGVIACAAAVVAVAIAPDCKGYLFAGHRSSEPGASVALEYLGLRPLIDLNLRLGEGTGACLALPVLQAAAKVLSEMATFESAGVSDHHD